MAYERIISTKFVTKGAEAVVAAQKRVARSFTAAGNKAKASAQRVAEWGQRNATALAAMAAAGVALLMGMIKNSPTLNALLGSTRMAFSLLAMEIGENVAPAFELLERASWALLDAWDGLSPTTQKLISWFILLGAVALIGVAGIIGLTVAVGALTAGAAIAIATMVSLVLGVGAVIAIFDIWGNGLSAVNVAFILLASVILFPLAPIILLAAGIAALENRFGIVTKTIDFLWSTMKTVFGWVKSGATVIWQTFADFMGRVWDSIKLLIGATLATIVAIFTGDTDKIGQIWRAFGDKIVSVWSGMGAKIKAAGKFLLNGVISIFTSIGTTIDGWLKNAVNWGIDLITNFVDGVISAAKSAASTISDIAADLMGPFTFDIAVNDRWAESSGRDLIAHFNKGIESASATLSPVGIMSPSAPPTGLGGGNSSVTNVTIGSVILGGDGTSMTAGTKAGTDLGGKLAMMLNKR